MEITTFFIDVVVNNKHTHTCGENVKKKILRFMLAISTAWV